MRYSDEELFGCKQEELSGLKKTLTFNDFCEYAIKRLDYLICKSMDNQEWAAPYNKHLINYRIKARKFYQAKKA